VLREEVELAGTQNGESTILHTELAVDVREIPFDCGNREGEVVSNFAIGTILGDQRQDFLLSLKGSVRLPAASGWSAAGLQQ
jgi:hypothetical protein